MDALEGLTLIELLVVLAIIGILAGIAITLVRPAAARSAAIAVAAELTSARLRALAGGVPTAVVASTDRRRVERKVGTPGDGAAEVCASGAADAVVDLTEYPRVSLASGLERGIVWFPTGWGRSCDGGGVYNGRILVRDARAAYAVVVSSAGRVRWEAAP